VYNVTVLAWEFHRHNLDGQECSHYCHPSLPQLWLWNVLNKFRQQQLPVVEDPPKQQQQAGCAVVFDWEERKFGTPRPDAAALAVRDGQKSFWKWLSSRSSFVSTDGVLVPPLVDSAAGNKSISISSSSDRKSDGTAGSVTAWQLLQKLLDLQLLQQPQQQQPPNQQQQQQQKSAGAPQQLPSQQEAHQQQQSLVARRQMPHVQQERARAEQLEKGSRTKGGPRSPYQQQQHWKGPGAPQQQLNGVQQQQGQEHVLVARLRRKKQQHQQRRAAASGSQGGAPAAARQQAHGG
jgi:hypothetical protein